MGTRLLLCTSAVSAGNLSKKVTRERGNEATREQPIIRDLSVRHEFISNLHVGHVTKILIHVDVVIAFFYAIGYDAQPDRRIANVPVFCCGGFCK